MEFAPDSTIYLLKAPIDNTYKHQLYFDKPASLEVYCLTTAKHTFTEYLFVRKNLPGGKVQSSIKVDKPIEKLYNVNYMMYKNSEYGMLFYCFITQLVYINSSTTEIIFETDVWNTWRWKVDILPSFVVREHSTTDEIGDNIVPESFTFQDYEYTEYGSDGISYNLGFLVGTSAQYGEDGARGTIQDGIYQGVFFYYFNEVTALNTFLDAIEAEENDCVLFISVVPDFCVSNHGITPIFENDTSQGYIKGTASPKETSFSTPKTTLYNNALFGGYTPVNKKLYTSPFTNLYLTNSTGGNLTLNIEDFSTDSVELQYNGDLSPTPSVMLVPKNYKGITTNMEYAMYLAAFPQCSYNTDTYKLWLSKNAFSLGTQIGQGIVNVGIGAASALAGMPMLGVSSALGGVNQIMGVMADMDRASKEPHQANTGHQSNNLLTAMGENRFRYYVRTIKKQYAQTLDEFFTKYGYQTNRVKVPNMDARPCFNYVQTMDVTITGEIPNDDLVKIKEMFNNGVTFWKQQGNASGGTCFPYFGDYTADNKPTT